MDKKDFHVMPDPKTNPANKKHKCEFCNRCINWSTLKRHKDACYLNPVNLKLCSICNEPIKDYNHLDICIKHRKIKYNLQKKVNCKFCSKPFTFSNIKKHEDYCYLNPLNLKNCPNCNKIMLNYKNKACSKECLRSLKGNKESHRLICFKFYKKECLVCMESNVVDVHHLDGDHTNDQPNNLIPLCPTHHTYLHRGFDSLIINQINEKIIKIN